MASFVVLQHGDELGAKRSEKTIFVRDTFSFVALAFPILWLLWHRLWLVAIFAICFSALTLASASSSMLPIVSMVMSLALSLVVALEGPSLRIKFAELSGYHQRAVIDADHLEEAELIWAMEQGGDIVQPAKKAHMANTALGHDLIFEGQS